MISASSAKLSGDSVVVKPSRSTPALSIVIPVFNEEAVIARCLMSVRNLDCESERYEVMIVDNGSTDRTHHVIRDLGFSFVVIPNVNVATLRNRGAGASRGEFLAFVDADIELAPYWVETGLAAFRDPNIVATGCFPEAPRSGTWVQRTWDLQQRGSEECQQVRTVSWLPSANLIVRRDAFLAIGGFDEALETGEDVDLGYRLGERGRLLNNPQMTATHWGADSDLKTFWYKEIWRGAGTLQGIFRHGIRLAELPSIGYPLYVFLLLCALVFAIGIDLSRGSLVAVPISLFVLVLPAMALSLYTAAHAGKMSLALHLCLLYLVYGCARAYALIRSVFSS